MNCFFFFCNILVNILGHVWPETSALCCHSANIKALEADYKLVPLSFKAARIGSHTIYIIWVCILKCNSQATNSCVYTMLICMYVYTLRPPDKYFYRNIFFKFFLFYFESENICVYILI